MTPRNAVLPALVFVVTTVAAVARWVLKRRQAGSVPTGPSPQYERLIRGEIKPKDYTSSVRKRVDQQRRSNGRSWRSLPRWVNYHTRKHRGVGPRSQNMAAICRPPNPRERNILPAVPESPVQSRKPTLKQESQT